MTPGEIKKWLENEIANYPERSDPPDFYAFMMRQIRKIMPHERAALVHVLKEWLRSPSAVTTNLTLEIAKTYQLCELKSALETLRNAIKAGKIFKPYYVNDVESTLKRLL